MLFTWQFSLNPPHELCICHTAKLSLRGEVHGWRLDLPSNPPGLNRSRQHRLPNSEMASWELKTLNGGIDYYQKKISRQRFYSLMFLLKQVRITIKYIRIKSLHRLRNFFWKKINLINVRYLYVYTLVSTHTSFPVFWTEYNVIAILLNFTLHGCQAHNHNQ